jgi:carbonic anhydrase/acetyltransferase-like protein (isoleucine patch superfamily)
VSLESFVDPGAVLIGDVRIEDNVLIGPQVALRGDEQGPFRVCKGSNIQDTTVFHGHKNEFVVVDGEKYSIFIGQETTIAHRGLIHGPTLIGDKTFIGANALIWGAEIGNRCFIEHGARVCNAKIGNDCLIGMGAVVRDVTIPDGTYVPDLAKVNKKTDLSKLDKVRPTELAKCRKKSGEIILINHDLVVKHRIRAQMKKDQEIQEMFARFMGEREKRIKELRQHPVLKDKPELLQAALIIVDTFCKTKHQRFNGGAEIRLTGEA